MIFYAVEVKQKSHYFSKYLSFFQVFQVLSPFYNLFDVLTLMLPTDVLSFIKIVKEHRNFWGFNSTYKDCRFQSNSRQCIFIQKWVKPLTILNEDAYVHHVELGGSCSVI